MKSRNTLNIQSVLLIIFLSLFTVACQNENSPNGDKLKIENILLKYHLKHASNKKLNKGINLLISKNINLEYKALFYQVKNSNRFYIALMDTSKNILNVVKLKKNNPASMFDNNLCIIKSKNVEGDDDPSNYICFTVFVGEIPFEGYSEIELDWNCSKKATTTETLVDKKYFLFLKSELGQNICNIKITNKKGLVKNLKYSTENGEFNQ